MKITLTDSSYNLPIYIDPSYVVVIRPISNGKSALVDEFGGVYNVNESVDEINSLIEKAIEEYNYLVTPLALLDVVPEDVKDQVIADLNQEIKELEDEVQELNDTIANLTDEDLDEEDEDDLDLDDDEDDDYDDEDDDEDYDDDDDLEDDEDYEDDYDDEDEDYTEDEDNEEELTLEEAIDVLLSVFDNGRE